MAEIKNIALHLHRLAVHLQCSLKTTDVFDELRKGTLVLPEGCSADVREAYKKYAKLQHRYDRLAENPNKWGSGKRTACNGCLQLTDWTSSEMLWAIDLWTKDCTWDLYRVYPDGKVDQWLWDFSNETFRWARLDVNYDLYDHQPGWRPKPHNNIYEGGYHYGK